jgi:hypothetical protein
MRTGDCRAVAEVIPQFAAGDAEVDERAAGHIEACLRCQAEVAAYRRILRHLHSLHDEGIPPPVGSLAALLAALDAAGEQRAGSATWAIRAATVGGITVVTAAAGAAGVLVWMRRRLAETG